MPGHQKFKARPDFHNYIIWHSSKGFQNLELKLFPEVFHTTPEQTTSKSHTYLTKREDIAIFQYTVLIQLQKILS